MRRRNSKGSVPPKISKAARALLDISQEEMAEKIGISSSTVRRFEGGIPMSLENEAKMVAFFKGHGLVFLYRNTDIIGLIQGGDIGDIIFDY